MQPVTLAEAMGQYELHWRHPEGHRSTLITILSHILHP